MPKKRFSAEQIVTLLRQIEVLMAQGKSARRPAEMQEYRNRTTRRAAQRRNLLQPERSTDRHRAMAQALQHDQTALSAQLSAAGAADIRALGSPPRWDHANAVISIPLVQKIHQVNISRGV